MKTRTKIASLLLAAVLLLGLLPAGVFSTAAEGLVLEFDTPDDAGLKRLYPKEPNSATNPYLVTSAEDWSNLTCVTPMRYEYYFLQTADIDLNTEMPTDQDVSSYTLKIAPING